jgi:hypothetical protein
MARVNIADDSLAACVLAVLIGNDNARADAPMTRAARRLVKFFTRKCRKRSDGCPASATGFAL